MRIENVDPEVQQIPVEAIAPGEAFRYHLTGALYLRLTRSAVHGSMLGGEPIGSCSDDHVPVVNLATGQVYTPVRGVLVEPVTAILHVA
jgi:hypothetical protein